MTTGMNCDKAALAARLRLFGRLCVKNLNDQMKHRLRSFAHGIDALLHWSARADFRDLSECIVRAAGFPPRRVLVPARILRRSARTHSKQF